MDIAYVYHVIGTLTWEHITLSLESLSRQDIRWRTFVLYNGGEFPDDDILELVPDKFDRVEVFPYDPGTPKSAIADWDVQMREIGGHDFYFVHKADFFLANGVCEAYEQTLPDLVLFNKIDMKEWVGPQNLRDLAALTWEEANGLGVIAPYQEHYGRMGVRFEQGVDGVDGTMHAYADSVRPQFSPSETEKGTAWDVAGCIQRLAARVGFSRDKRFFALHMWHDVPQKNDAQKLMAGERF